MPAPTITALPPAPDRADAPATFVTDADTFVAALPELVSDINAFGTYLDGLALSGVSGPIISTALTMATARVLGRTTASSGAIEEISIGSGLSLAAGVLSATGGAGDLLASNNLSDVANAATALANLGLRYRFGFFFTTVPTASEVLCLHIAPVAFTIPANFATPNAVGAIGTNPTASFAIDVQRQVNATGAFSTIGTITISTGGAFTFATASGTSKAIAANDVLKFIAPGSADATCANVAITMQGVY